MKNNWISVKEKLPQTEGIKKVKSEAVMTETAYTFKYGFDYDMQCEEYAAIAGIGTPDKITHWLDDSDESV